MADFNLQFLNGVGESYDKPVRSYQEREVVSPLTRGDYGDGMLVDENGSAAFDNTSDALIYDHHCHCHGRCIENALNARHGRIFRYFFRSSRRSCTRLFGHSRPERNALRLIQQHQRMGFNPLSDCLRREGQHNDNHNGRPTDKRITTYY